MKNRPNALNQGTKFRFLHCGVVCDHVEIIFFKPFSTQSDKRLPHGERSSQMISFFFFLFLFRSSVFDLLPEIRDFVAIGLLRGTAVVAAARLGMMNIMMMAKLRETGRRRFPIAASARGRTQS